MFSYLRIAMRKLLNDFGIHTMALGIAKNSAWLLLDKFIRLGLGLTVGVLIARHFGPHDYGILSYAIAFVGLFTALVSLGLDGIVLRELSVKPQDKNKILGAAIVLKTLAGLICFAAILIYCLNSKSNEPATLILISIIGASLIFQSFDVADAWFQSIGQAKYITYARGSAFLFSALVKIVFLYTNAPLIAFALIYSCEIIVAGALLWLIYSKTETSASELIFDKLEAISLLKESWPLCLSSIFVILTMQLDKIILKYLLGNEAVGIYSVGTQISTIWYIVPVVLGSTLAPHISRVSTDKQVAYTSTIQNIYTTMSVIAVSAGIFFYFTAAKIIVFLYGTEYSDAGNILVIHIWSAVFIFHVSIRTRILTAEKKQTLVAFLAFLTLLISIPLNFILIQSSGIVGAAYAFLISWFMCAAVFPIFREDTRQSMYKFFRSLIPIYSK